MIDNSKYLKYFTCCAYGLAALMVSCSSEDSEPQCAGSEELVFVTAEPSRAAVTTTTNLTAKPFAVYGDVCLATGESEPTELMNGRQATYNSSEKKWNYGTTLYWFPNHIHSFVALHPIEAINKTRTVTDVKYSEGGLSFNYTHPSDYKNASDLLVATHRRRYDQELGKTADPVSFTFEHILSVLDIRIMYNEELAYTNQNNRIEITEIVLDGINVSGSYDVRPDDLNETNARSGTDAHVVRSGWSNLKSGSRTFSGNVYKDWSAGHVNQYDTKSSVFKPVFENNDAITVLPKEAGDVTLTMKFRLYVNITHAADHTLSTVLKDVEWKAGQKITYNLQVSVGEILQGGCTFEDWNVITGLTETITDASGDHDAGKGNLDREDWYNFNNGW